MKSIQFGACSDPAGSNGAFGPSPHRKRNKEGASPMFARIVEFVPKAEKKEDLIKVVRQEILPILRKQPGFLELMPFDPELKTEKAVAITLWTEKYEAEKYARDVFVQVEQTLRPFLSTPIMVRNYKVEISLCKHLVETLIQAA